MINETILAIIIDVYKRQVSQALSLVLIIVAAANLIYHHRKLQRETKGEAQHGNFERGTETKD